MLTLFSCAKETLNPAEPSFELSALEVENLCQLGHDHIDNVRENYVVVDGDILYYRPALRELETIEKPLWQESGLEASDRQLTFKELSRVIAYDNLTIKAYAEGFSLAMLQELVLAARVWNSQVHCKVRFEITREPLGADMTIRNSTNTTLGQACFPINGQVGNLIELNENNLYNLPLTFNGPNCGPFTRTLDIQERVNIMIHEMGHTIGFFHADSNPNSITGNAGCGNTVVNEGFLLHGTTPNDISSVMTSGPIQLGASDCNINGINPADLRAAQLLYPDPGIADIPDIASITTVSGNTRRLTINYPASPAYYQVEICISPAGAPFRCFFTPATQNTFDFLAPPGFTLVRIAGLNYRGDFRTNYVQDGVQF